MRGSPEGNECDMPDAMPQKNMAASQTGARHGPKQEFAEYCCGLGEDFPDPDIMLESGSANAIVTCRAAMV